MNNRLEEVVDVQSRICFLIYFEVRQLVKIGFKLQNSERAPRHLFILHVCTTTFSFMIIYSLFMRPLCDRTQTSVLCFYALLVFNLKV